jgi:class 3 adenylate cyclase
MSLREDLESEVARILRGKWETRDGQVVPQSEDLKLGNDAVKLKGTVLYADMADSTSLVDNYKPHLAAEVYKTFLHCAAKIVRSEGGDVTAYDGDRLMGVFVGDSKNTSAVRAALKIHWSQSHIVNPALKNQYDDATYPFQHTVGIDTSDLWVARTGIRGSNDLVWVGRAANHAAKLCNLGPQYPTWITADVFNTMHSSVKTTSDGRNMWDQRVWKIMNDRTIYRSNFWWAL